ncbi:hypothetical protein MUK42_18693 [Musa troglodytarum]|uniref:GDSL esterase/lipase n=1 Tax=Musa troglodytarum TaxID=320322 RepID=A0A9E7JFN6_9LILI|nr:hypothetical protein MUK42_18693 [Musa troglodytarum]
MGGNPLRLPALLILLLCSPAVAHSKCVLFNFGDSNSDTGGLMAGLGLYLGPPSGRQFFHRPTGRFCDGRLYIDFVCERLKMSYLTPYLESSPGSNFTHGVNFAVAGAATESTAIPFPLSTQVLQFLHFKNRTRELRPQGSGSLLSEKEFQNAVYSIDIGQNDVSTPFSANLSYAEVVVKIPSILSRIRAAIEASQSLVHIQKLALLKKDDSELDPLGCLADLNSAAKAFNAGLSELCDLLRSEFKNATIVYTDVYAIKQDLIANHTKYGFENPLMACCGYGGPPYNYKFRMTCGEPMVTACAEGSRYISWDGVHNTEAANSIIASKILSAKYSRPQIKLKGLCKG